MALDVHLSVVFPCDRNDGVARLALKHLASLPNDAQEECRWFLTALAERSGYNPGPKGGLSLWGTVGNYTRSDEFVTSLSPFWEELIGRNDEGEHLGGPLAHEHVIVFYETQGAQSANCYEIGRGDDGVISFKHHERLPFAWMQF